MVSPIKSNLKIILSLMVLMPIFKRKRVVIVDDVVTTGSTFMQ